jgi:HAD superfamily hydrolase (TIGR01509 family)
LKKVILFDFHNTLVVCDEWLDLEIKTLPALAIRKLISRSIILEPPPGCEENATALFRALRQRVHASGVEISALDGVREVLKEMDMDVPKEEVARAVEELELAILPGVVPVDGVEHTLEELRGLGFRLGVVSSAGYPAFVELALEELAMRPYFSEVITTGDVGIYKSNPEIFRLAAEKLGAKPEEAVHVGDHARFDVETARAAGLATVWFAANARRAAEAHGQDWPEIERIGSKADAIIMHMSELVPAVEALG